LTVFLYFRSDLRVGLFRHSYKPHPKETTNGMRECAPG